MHSPSKQPQRRVDIWLHQPLCPRVAITFGLLLVNRIKSTYPNGLHHGSYGRRLWQKPWQTSPPVTLKRSMQCLKTRLLVISTQEDTNAKTVVRLIMRMLDCHHEKRTINAMVHKNHKTI